MSNRIIKRLVFINFLIFILISIHYISVYADEDNVAGNMEIEYVTVIDLCNAELNGGLSFLRSVEFPSQNNIKHITLNWESDKTGNVYTISVIEGYVTLYKCIDGFEDYYEADSLCNCIDGQIYIPISIIQDYFGFIILPNTVDETGSKIPSKISITEGPKLTYNMTSYGAVWVDVQDVKPLKVVMNTGDIASTDGVIYKNKPYINLRSLSDLDLYGFSDMYLNVNRKESTVKFGWDADEEDSTDYFHAVISSGGAAYNRCANGIENSNKIDDMVSLIRIDEYNYISLYLVKSAASIMTVEDISNAIVYIPGTIDYDLYNNGDSPLIINNYKMTNREINLVNGKSVSSTSSEISVNMSEGYFGMDEGQIKEIKETYGDSIVNTSQKISSTRDDFMDNISSLSEYSTNLKNNSEEVIDLYNKAKLIQPIVIDTAIFGDSSICKVLESTSKYIKDYDFMTEVVDDESIVMSNRAILSLNYVLQMLSIGASDIIAI